MGVFVGLGACGSAVLRVARIVGPVTATRGDDHIRYGIGLHAGFLIVVAYIAVHGVKTPDAVADQLAAPYRIAPNLRSFNASVPTGVREEVAVA